MGENRVTRVARAQRDHKIIAMTLAGATEEAIADALDCRVAYVRRSVTRQLERWRENDQARIEDVRNLQLARIDRLIQALWPDAVGMRDDGSKKPASPKAVGEIRQLEALRARIAGTEAPKKIELSGDIGIAMDLDEQARLEAAWAASGGEVIEGTAEEIPELPAGLGA